MSRTSTHRTVSVASFLGLLFVVLVTSPFAQTSEKVIPKNSGVTLETRIKAASNGESSEIEFIVFNESQSTITYDIWLDTLGFDFRLVDTNGIEIPMNDQWFRFHSPRYREWAKTRSANLSPKDRISYTLNLKEAFGDNWKRGEKLKIEWLQEGALARVPTLTTEVHLTNHSKGTNIFKSSDAQGASIQANQTTRLLNPPSELPTAPKMPNGEKSVAVNEEESASTTWLVCNVLIVAVIGLLWLVLKNRK